MMYISLFTLVANGYVLFNIPLDCISLRMLNWTKLNLILYLVNRIIWLIDYETC